MRIKVSAPGKLMLMGEHAVVYGYPCIVTAVDKRLYVEAEKIDEGEDKIVAPQVKESRFVLESIATFKEKFGISKSVKISTKGDFSHNVGLGSSSAVTVATFKALSLLFDVPMTNKQIFSLSYKVNLKIQGVGSGFDIAAATFGRTLYFVSGGKLIEPLHIDKLALVVGYSGIKADTPFYIRKVAEAFKNKKNEMDEVFKQINILVVEGKQYLNEKKYSSFGEKMTQNHKLLQKLGISIPKLDQMVEESIRAGAYGAKLSGAGGGDCMIALSPQNKILEIEKAIEKVGGEIIKVNNNAEGVKIEN